jgi:hypothetical protein
MCCGFLVVSVSIVPERGRSYKGFLLQARSVPPPGSNAPPRALGRFVGNPMSTKQLDCDARFGAVTHTDESTKTGTLSFSWNPLGMNHGNVQFV